MKINGLLADIEAGKGLAGTLLKNDDMARDLSITVSNLSVFSGNLNAKGLWGVFRKPKQEKSDKKED
jgi:hypothetical protein